MHAPVVRGLITTLIMFVILFASVPASAEEVVQQAAASGTRNLRPFTVKDGWELRWTASGPIFTVILHAPNGDPVDTIAVQTKPGPGATYYPTGGTYYLQISGAGDWSISVVQLP